MAIYLPSVRKAEWLLNSDSLASGMASLKKDLNGEVDLGALEARLMNVLEVIPWPLKCLNVTEGNRNVKEN